MQLHQDSFTIQPETGRNGDKIDTHNTHIYDHSLPSDLVQTLQYNVTWLNLLYAPNPPHLLNDVIM